MPPLIDPVVPPGGMADGDQPVVRGDGLVLRPWTATDAPVLLTAFADPDIQRWHGRTIDGDGEAIDVIRTWQHSWATEAAARWLITAHDDAPLGQIGLRTVDLADGHAEVSYWVLPDARRQGVAVRALLAVTGWALNDLGLHRVELQHSTQNPASCGVAEQAGFAAEGTLRERGLHADGWHDMHLHARLRRDR